MLWGDYEYDSEDPTTDDIRTVDLGPSKYYKDP